MSVKSELASRYLLAGGGVSWGLLRRRIDACMHG